MATINSVGNGLTGATGTGLFVGSTSPTLVTPTLGVALATSINFGGSPLSNYVSEGLWTPAITFATPGNLSVAYSDQLGYYTRIGSFVRLSWYLTFIPTYTTASGAISITGLPFTSYGSGGNTAIGGFISGGLLTYPTGCTNIQSYIQQGSSIMSLIAQGTGVFQTPFSTTQFLTATTYQIFGSIDYLV